MIVICVNTRRLFFCDPPTIHPSLMNVNVTDPGANCTPHCGRCSVRLSIPECLVAGPRSQLTHLHPPCTPASLPAHPLAGWRNRPCDHTAKPQANRTEFTNALSTLQCSTAKNAAPTAAPQQPENCREAPGTQQPIKGTKKASHPTWAKRNVPRA